MDREKLIIELKEYKIKNRLTYAQISDEIGIPLSTINAWIRGYRAPSEVAVVIIKEFLSSKKSI